MGTSTLLEVLQERTKLSNSQLAELLGTSPASISRWQSGAGHPSASQLERITALHNSVIHGQQSHQCEFRPFKSKRVGARIPGQRMLGQNVGKVEICDSALPPIIERISRNNVFDDEGEAAIQTLLGRHSSPAATVQVPFSGGISAGKNTYTYDAHTYHTKVPPQGISELLRYYLPQGGLVVDPFSGSGMTGVAASVLGYDCLLNELSPAACFISDRFTRSVNPAEFEDAVREVTLRLQALREKLYTTECRECGRETEVLYTVWSYNVLCADCNVEFLLWDHCKKFGRTVREHKILAEFPCPACGQLQHKSRLARTSPVPVVIGYKCCGSKQQEVTQKPSVRDIELIKWCESSAPLAEGYFPELTLPDGVNLRQPAKHGFDRIDKFYTRRNLSALSHIWETIHHITCPQLAAHLAFVFTSLYQRVTKLSEFRFWGGSGNMARFNVPFIFNETNVFGTFERKARTILDHLESTADNYSGRVVVINGSATDLEKIPDHSVDLVFTDPPFGGNINYSEMNILWESWLGRFTDTKFEAIVNRVQRKGIKEYECLMIESLKQCSRILRDGHWMLLVFMNSSRDIWAALQRAVTESGFEVKRLDIFDKQHGTFKQFVSDNTAGMDLVLHCLKTPSTSSSSRQPTIRACATSIAEFLRSRKNHMPMNTFLHVGRDSEIDYRTLFSEWLALCFGEPESLVDFSVFREIAAACIERDGQ